MKVARTPRNFEVIHFVDRNGRAGSVQASSAVDADGAGVLLAPGASALWIGPDGDRLHLSRAMVAELLRHLDAWVKSGSLRSRRAGFRAAARRGRPQPVPWREADDGS